MFLTPRPPRRALEFLQRYTTSSPTTIINIPKAHVFRFGDSNRAEPVFRDLEWTVNEGESWAVVGSGSGEKTTLFQTLLGHLRISPPPPPPAGLFPFLSLAPGPPRDPHLDVALVSFGHRRSPNGAFYDYTARYGAVRDEDRVTLRESIFPAASAPAPGTPAATLFTELVAKTGLTDFLDLPLVALSNGQTRRARIVKAVLAQPALLFLDEPLTGLDVHHRPTLLELLHALHIARKPRVMLGMRAQDPLPEWISHVALVKDGRVHTGPRDAVLAAHAHSEKALNATAPPVLHRDDVPRETLVDMKNVRVSYHERKVLKDISWEIRQGDRWHLQGANGSGKTTLLALLTGDHPQSYTQRAPASALMLFGRARPRIATAELRTHIGVVSPELANAFPRRAGMSVRDAVGTGFDGGFVPLGADAVGVGLAGVLEDGERAWRVARVWEVLRALGPAAWAGVPDSEAEAVTRAFAAREFAGLSAGEQGAVLLMRALVGRPPLVLLDEVWSGMDAAMVRAARAYLRGDGVGPGQAVIVISHWEEEVPWGKADGVRRYVLDGGVGREV